MPTTIAPGDFVRIHNNEDRVVNFPYGSRDYLVRPQSDAMVPFDAALYWLGDPRSLREKYVIVGQNGEKEWIESREYYLQTLSVRYGTYDGGNISGKDGFDQEGNPVWFPGIKERMPNVSVYTLENDPIIFPADDPFCHFALPPDEQATAAGAMAKRIHDLENQLLGLKQLLDESQNKETEEATIHDIKTDGPPAPPPIHVNAQPNPDAPPTFSPFETELPEDAFGGDTQIDSPDIMQPPRSRINPIRMADPPD